MEAKPKEDSANLYSLQFNKRFEKDLKNIKTLYKSDAPREDLLAMLDSFLDALETNPRDESLSALEGWPKKSHEEPWELRKIRFNLPQLTGAVSKGRIIYVFNPDTRVVELLCFYTHKTYQKRPPDDLLKKILKSVISG